MRMNPNKFNETHLILKEEDEIFDTLDFNIHLVSVSHIIVQNNSWEIKDSLGYFGEE
jgi:hypothetical protein